jgi:hypothetical protein
MLHFIPYLQKVIQFENLKKAFRMPKCQEGVNMFSR